MPRHPLPLPEIQISLEDLPPSESRRTHTLALLLTAGELAMVDDRARCREETPAVFCRTVVLAALQSSAFSTLAEEPDVSVVDPLEMQQALLDLFEELETPCVAEAGRTGRLDLALAERELAVIRRISYRLCMQPAALCRTIILAAFRNSALRAVAEEPGLIQRTPAEEQRLLLEALDFED